MRAEMEAVILAWASSLGGGGGVEGGVGGIVNDGGRETKSGGRGSAEEKWWGRGKEMYGGVKNDGPADKRRRSGRGSSMFR